MPWHLLIHTAVGEAWVGGALHYCEVKLDENLLPSRHTINCCWTGGVHLFLTRVMGLSERDNKSSGTAGLALTQSFRLHWGIGAELMTSAGFQGWDVGGLSNCVMRWYLSYIHTYYAGVCSLWMQKKKDTKYACTALHSQTFYMSLLYNISCICYLKTLVFCVSIAH